MYILGINSAYHESSACLIKDGVIISASEEERFSRVKHAKHSKVDNPDELPFLAITSCLNEASKQEGKQITLEDVDYVGYSLNPKVRLEKNIRHEHPYVVTLGDFGTKEGEQIFYNKNLEVKKKLRQLGFRGNFYYLNHHDCHAASSFFVSPYEEAATLVLDGIGEFESTTLYRGKGNKLKRIVAIDYPNSVGLLWEKISKFLGFSAYDSSKVMGLASYGDPLKYMEQFRKFVNFDENGMFAIDDSRIRFRNEDYSGLTKLFNLERRSEPIKNVNRRTREYADVASTLQEITNVILLNLARYLKKKTSSKYLCLSGGVALNCVANGRLIQEHLFDDVFIQPAANDGGTAIGAAFYIWNQLLGKSRGYVFESPYLGPSFSEDEIVASLDKKGLQYTRRDDVAQFAAKLIAKGNIIAWFQGKMEIGPRALGNRSIIADPRKREIVAELNYKVKHRESFRPFCPSVLKERVCDWFNNGMNSADPTKYMLAAINVLDYRSDTIPAVTHIDGTSRIQTIRYDLNPRYYNLIRAFEKRTGVPIVLNTSFNNQEPIVCSPEDAIRTFLNVDIDYLVIGDFIVSKAENREDEKIPKIPLKDYFEKLR